MTGAFVAGAIAGYGVAIPVGAIAILIIDTALRRGLRDGLAAGAGAATADGLYATIAGLGGAAIAGIIAPWSGPIRWLSIAVLVVIAARGLRAVRHEMTSAAAPSAAAPSAAATSASVPDRRRRPIATYLRFVGLTIVNPMTVVYFAALVVGLPAIGGGIAERLAFAAGAFLASISWQSLLAVVGAVVHRRLPLRSRLYTSVVGNVIVLGLAANIARGLIAT
jgi:threonine/homoserine/homoserine lactone efflux protein